MDVTLIPNPNFEAATPEEKARFLEVEKRGELLRVPMTTATENIKLSGGMYKVKPEAASAPSAPNLALSLDDMSNEDLKLMMLRAGVTPQKQMKRPEVIKAIRIKLAEVEIEGDEPGA
jgi:hypothetical protein